MSKTQKSSKVMAKSVSKLTKKPAAKKSSSAASNSKTPAKRGVVSSVKSGNAKTSAKPAASKSLFKKTALGLTAATMLAGAGSSPAQAGYFTDAFGGAFSDAGTVAKAGVKATLKAASLPFALMADTASWARKNPRVAVGVATLAAIGTAAVAWYGLSQVDKSEESQGVLKGLADTAYDWLPSTGQGVAKFFGGSKAYDETQQAFRKLVDHMGTYIQSADLSIKDAAGFVQRQNAAGAEFMKAAKGMIPAAQTMAAGMAEALQKQGGEFMKAAKGMIPDAQKMATDMAEAVQTKGAAFAEAAKGMAVKVSEDRMAQGAAMGLIAAQATSFLKKLRNVTFTGAKRK